jgi:hypothetical protein
MRGETSDLALREHTHRRAQKEALLSWPGLCSIKRPVTVIVMSRSR